MLDSSHVFSFKTRQQMLAHLALGIQGCHLKLPFCKDRIIQCSLCPMRINCCVKNSLRSLQFFSHFSLSVLPLVSQPATGINVRHVHQTAKVFYRFYASCTIRATHHTLPLMLTNPSLGWGSPKAKMPPIWQLMSEVRVSETHMNWGISGSRWILLSHSVSSMCPSSFTAGCVISASISSKAFDPSGSIRVHQGPFQKTLRVLEKSSMTLH